MTDLAIQQIPQLVPKDLPPGVCAVEITEAQADLLGHFQTEMRTLQDRMGLVLAGVLAGHDIKSAELISIAGRMVTVRVIDGHRPA